MKRCREIKSPRNSEMSDLRVWLTGNEENLKKYSYFFDVMDLFLFSNNLGRNSEIFVVVSLCTHVM